MCCLIPLVRESIIVLIKLLNLLLHISLSFWDTALNNHLSQKLKLKGKCEFNQLINILTIIMDRDLVMAKV